MNEGKLDFSTPVINFTTGKELLNPSTEELERYGVKEGDGKALELHRDDLTKYTLADVLNGMFDLIPLKNKTQFSLYNQTLIEIRHAKHRNETAIVVTKEELENLKAIFGDTPPEKPELNRNVGFILECVDKSYVDMMSTIEPKTAHQD